MDAGSVPFRLRLVPRVMRDLSIILLSCFGAFGLSMTIAAAAGLIEGLLSARVKEPTCLPSEST
jgi:hypothetical protein